MSGVSFQVSSEACHLSHVTIGVQPQLWTPLLTMPKRFFVNIKKKKLKKMDYGGQKIFANIKFIKFIMSNSYILGP